MVRLFLPRRSLFFQMLLPNHSDSGQSQQDQDGSNAESECCHLNQLFLKQKSHTFAAVIDAGFNKLVLRSVTVTGAAHNEKV